MQSRSRGFTFALAAFLAWGFFPIYFKSIRSVPPLEILAHRVVWSVVLLVFLVHSGARWAGFRDALRPGKRGPLALTAVLIAANWLIYIWAVNSGRVLEASLGYFVNPLVNVLLGVAFLGETLTGRQKLAVALAGAGVLALVVRLGVVPWLPLSLALSFGLYALLRKKAGIDAIGGLLGETLLLAPVALGFLVWREASGVGVFGQRARHVAPPDGGRAGHRPPAHLVRGGRATPAARHRRAHPVPDPHLPVPPRGGAVPRALHAGARGRLRLHLGLARDLQLGRGGEIASGGGGRRSLTTGPRNAPPARLVPAGEPRGPARPRT